MEALIDTSNEINRITLMHTLKLGLQIWKTDSRA